MEIIFKRDKQGNIIAIDTKGNEIGKVETMGDNIRKETRQNEKR